MANNLQHGGYRNNTEYELLPWRVARIGLYGFGSGMGLVLWIDTGNFVYGLQFVATAVLGILHGLKVVRLLKTSVNRDISPPSDLGV